MAAVLDSIGEARYGVVSDTKVPVAITNNLAREPAIVMLERCRRAVGKEGRDERRVRLMLERGETVAHVARAARWAFDDRSRNRNK